MIRRIKDAAFRSCLIRLRTLRYAGFSVMLAVLPGGDASAEPRAVSITAVSAPIMDAASADAQELGRAPKGTRLAASGRTSGDWLEIQAPEFISGWVYGELVRDGLIAASSVKVRSGPGIGYEALGTLTRGEAVVVRGRRGDWVEIGGQPSLLVWIERAMVAEGAAVDLSVTQKTPVAPEPVEQAVVVPPAVVSPGPPVPEPPVPEPVLPAPPPPVPVRTQVVAVPAPPPPKVPVKPAAPPVVYEPAPPPVVHGSVEKPFRPPAVPVVVPVPEAPAVSVRRTASQRRASPVARSLSPVGVRLLASAPQGEPVDVSGVLRPVGAALFQPAPYRLVAPGGGGPARTVCYVTSPIALPPIGSSVRLQGLKYWVFGSRQPVVLVRDISPLQGLTGSE